MARPPEVRGMRLSNYICALGAAAALTACIGGFETDPLVEFSTEIVVQGEKPQVVARQLRAGTYLVEIRERDIDLRARVDAGTHHTELADAYLRHGLHRTVVSLDSAQTLKVTLSSIDQRSWRGAAAVRILRWPKAARDAPPDERLLGFIALAKGNELVARGTRESWRAAIAPMNEAAEHFRAANDLRSLAETEYQRGFVEFNLLLDFAAARKSAEAAQAHFRAVDDELGAMRTSLLLSLAEVNVIDELSGDEQLARFDILRARLRMAQEYFDAHGAPSDACQAINLRAIPDTILGNYEQQAQLYE